MMRVSQWNIAGALSAIVAAAILGLTGCAESTTERDVAAARNDLREEQRELDEAQREAARDVADAERQAREQTVKKPVVSDEVVEAQREATERIESARRDVEDAQAEVRRLESELQATRSREEFVAVVEQRLASAKTRIDQLESQASGLEGTVRQSLDARVKSLNEQHDRAEDALGNLKSADVANWSQHRAAVQTALSELTTELNAKQ